jgi:predicted N-acetyltransferase YhbS
MKVVEFGRLAPEQRAELEGDEDDPFDAAGSTLAYQPKHRHVGIQDDRGRLVASTGMLVAEVEVRRQSFSAVGLGGVIVRADHRGQGLAREVVQAALATARTLGPAFALLFCHEDRAELYRKLGFAEITSEVLVKQPDGYAPMPDRTMWLSLHPPARWPDGAVTVESLPF